MFSPNGSYYYLRYLNFQSLENSTYWIFHKSMACQQWLASSASWVLYTVLSQFTHEFCSPFPNIFLCRRLPHTPNASSFEVLPHKSNWRKTSVLKRKFLTMPLTTLSDTSATAFKNTPIFYVVDVAHCWRNASRWTCDRNLVCGCWSHELSAAPAT